MEGDDYEYVSSSRIEVGDLVVRTANRPGVLGASTPGSRGVVEKINPGPTLLIIWDTRGKSEVWDKILFDTKVLARVIPENQIDEWAEILQLEP